MLPTIKTRIKNITKSWLVGVATFAILILISFFNFLSPITLAQTEATNTDIQIQKEKLAKDLSSLDNDLEDVTKLKLTLKEEIAQNEGDIKKTDNMIIEATNLLSDLQIQIDQNQTDLNKVIDEMKSLVVELQKQQNISPLETVIGSKNLAEAITNLYNTASLQNKADQLRSKIEEKNRTLEQYKLDTEKTKKDLEDTKFILASKKASLEDLKNQTQNDEAKYQQIRKTLISQASQLASKEQESRSQSTPVNSPSGKTPNAQTSCWFEESRVLDIPSGYLSSPATGKLEQVFNGCRHDGADISNGLNTELRAVASGVIAKKGYDAGGYGNYVLLKITVPSGQKIYALYAHMNSSSPKSVGESVSRGQVLGYMGKTGLATGVHLHFMLYSDSYENKGLGCRLGLSKCYNPTKFISF